MVKELKNSRKRYPLNTGDQIPAIGLGTWQSPPDEVRKAVAVALQCGYRHVDTARAYKNEKEVGDGIKASGVARQDIWITTKLANTDHKRVAEALEESLQLLGTDYLDLYLMHWPCSTDPADTTKMYADWDYVDTWHEMQKLVGSGKVRNIGVSNFGVRQLQRLLDDPATTIVPAVNQIELHPYRPSSRLVAYNASKGIHSTGYSCLGSTNSPLYSDPALLDLARRRNLPPQQLMLLWGIQKGWSVLPKSVTPDRIRANIDIDGWSLRAEDIKAIDGMTRRMKVCDGAFLPKDAVVFYDDDE